MITKKVYTVIVAEDEELLLMSLVNKIEACDCGFKVIGFAEDGQEAYRLVEKLNPHVIFSDIEMPIINGLELLKKITQNYSHIQKVIVSGYNDFDFAQQAIKLGVKEYLLKPIRNEDLMKTLANLKIVLDALDSQIENSSFDLKNVSAYSSEEIALIVEKYILENYVQDLTLVKIAAHFGFNPTYLSRIFTKHIGKNPSTYLISLRLNKAKGLLKNNPQLSVKNIGQAVGYPNPYYFSRIFKKHIGTCPENFRKE